MASQHIRGRAAPIATGPDQRSSLNSGLGDANVQDRGLHFGKVAHGEDAGKMDGCYRKIATKPGTSIYEVQHDLGRIPGFAFMVASEHNFDPTTHYAVSAFERQKWTTSSVRVRVLNIAGSLDGGEIFLLIGGER